MLVVAVVVGVEGTGDVLPFPPATTTVPADTTDFTATVLLFVRVLLIVWVDPFPASPWLLALSPMSLASSVEVEGIVSEDHNGYHNSVPTMKPSQPSTVYGGV